MAWHISNKLYEKWRSSQALEVASLAESSSDGNASVQSSGNPTPLLYLPPDRMKAFSRLSRYGMTFRPLTEDHGEDLLTWYREASLAKTSAAQGKAQASPASDPECGGTWRGSLARYDRDTSSWRIAQGSFFEECNTYSGTFPRWGTIRNGVLLARGTPVLPTNEKGSGYWLTPRASDMGKGEKQSTFLKRMGDRTDRCFQSLPAQLGGRPNPTWVEWLMGWPLYWTSLEKIPIFAYQQWQDETGNWKEAGATDVPDEAMRNVWWSNDPSAAPRGWECDEQRSGQCESALSKVPHEGSHDDRKLGARGSEDCGLPCLWEEFQTEENEAGEAVWKCGVCQRTRPKVGRVAMGITSRVDRAKAIGNGQVPRVMAMAFCILHERLSKRVGNGA